MPGVPLVIPGSCTVAGKSICACPFVIVNVANDRMHIFDPTHSWESKSGQSEEEAIAEYEREPEGFFLTGD